MSKGEAFWRPHVAASGRGGARLAAYAQEHGLNVSTLRWWRSRLREEVGAARQPLSSSRFVAMSVMQAVEYERQPMAATVTIGERVRVELTAMPSPHWLAQLDKALQEASGCIREA